MSWPTSQDFNEAVQTPETNLSDPALKRGQVAVNALGLPVPRSGNFADVYQFTDGDGRVWALKCFTRQVPGLRERYAKIDEHLNKNRLPFTVGFQFLQEGIRVRGAWYPLLKMEWVEGFTLNEFAAQSLGRPAVLHALLQMWAKLAGRLRDAHMAHADLQHGNVLLVPGATPQKLGLKLIDYDGMFVPALADYPSGEVGHPNYQHPLRLKEGLYTGDVDRVPHLVIGAGLRAALVGGKAVWERFDNEDNILFKEADLRDPARSPVFQALWELNDPVLRALVGHLALAIRQPLRKAPWLDDLLLEEGGAKLTVDQEKQVCELLGVARPSAAATAAAPPARVEQEFNAFDFSGEEESPEPSEDELQALRRPAARKGTQAARRGPRPKEAKRRSQAPLLIGLIGGGVVFAGLAFGAVALLIGLGKKDPPTVAQKEQDERPVPPKGSGPPNVDPKKEKDPPPSANPEGGKEDLRQSLAGTQWSWGDGTLTLKEDGTIHHPVWNNQFRLTGRWEAVDRRTVAMIMDQVRNNNRLAVLEFAEDLGQFTGFDFLFSPPRMPAKKRIGPLSHPVRRIPAGAPADPKADLRQRLANSRWEWSDGPLTLGGDGQVVLPKTAGPAPRWEVIDRRTAMLVYESGRPVNRFAVLHFSEDVTEYTGFDFDAARLPARKRLGADPGGAGSKGAAVGVAALPGPRNYLFIRDGDPVLYRTEGGSARKAHELGRHAAPIRVLAASADGKWAVTGSEDGEVRGWDLTGSGPKPAGKEPTPVRALTTKVAGPARMDGFPGEYEYTLYREGIRIRDVKAGKDEVVYAGPPVTGAEGPFKAQIENPKSPFGPPVSKPTPAFDGTVTVQLFRRGFLVNRTGTNRDWNLMIGGGQSELGDPDGPRPEPKPLATRLHGPTKVVSGAYEYTLYREGILVRDTKSGKEATVYAGRVLADTGGPFAKLIRPGTAHEHPVSPATDIFDGTLTVQLFRRGFAMAERGLVKHTFSAGSDKIGEPDPATGGSPPVPLKEHTGAVVACAVFPDGGRAVSAGADGLVCEWDLAAGKLAHKVRVADPRAVACLPDGKSVVVGTAAGKVELWDLAKEERVKELPGQSGPVATVVVAPKGDLVCTGSTNGNLHGWALPEGRALYGAGSDPRGATALTISPDGRSLAVAGPAGRVRFLDPRNGRPQGEHPTNGPVHALAFVDGGQGLVIGQAPNPITVRVNIADPAGGAGPVTLLQETEPAAEPAVRLFYSPDGAILLAVRKSTVAVLDGATGKELRNWPADGDLGHAAFGPGKEVYLVWRGGKFQAWNWETGEKRAEYDAVQAKGTYAREVLPTPTADRLLVTTPSPVLLLWDVAGWKEAERFNPYPTGFVSHPAPYPDGKRLAAVVVGGGDERHPAVWDLAKRSEAFALEPVDAKNLFALEVSPTGKWVVGFAHGRGVGQMHVWDATDGKLRHTIPNVHTVQVSGGFAPGGNRYVVCCYGNRRLVVDLERGTVDSHQPQITHQAAATAPAAGLLATSDADRRIRIWRVAAEK